MNSRLFSLRCLFVIIGLIYCIFALPVQADEEDTWTGFYLGINGGYGLGKSTGALSTSPSQGRVTNSSYFLIADATTVTAAGQGTIKLNGLLGGITLGYNYLDINKLWGIEADFALTNNNKTRVETGQLLLASANFTVTRKIKNPWLSTIRGKLGYVLENNAVYATAGLAAAALDTQSEYSDNFGPDSIHPVLNMNKTQLGWVAGVGYEHQFDNDWSIKFDYLYTRFPDIAETVNCAPSYPNTLFTDKENLSANLFRIGFNKTWNW